MAQSGGRYTKHIYIGSQRIVSKLGDFDSYGADPRRIEKAGDSFSGVKVDYASKYKSALNVVKANYETLKVPYYGLDNDDYVNGLGFCCNPNPTTATTSPTGKSASNKNDNAELQQYYYHPDHLGSSSYITNLDGEVVQHVEYVPFGEVFLEEKNSNWNTPYLFNGKELDKETGMSYYGARYYDSKISVWISTDPLSGYNPIFETEHYIDGQHNGGVYNSFNHNTYGYCYQNPIILIDPNGKQTFFMNTRNFSPVKSFGALFRFTSNYSLAPSWSGDDRTYSTSSNAKYRIGGTATINMDKMTVTGKAMPPAETHNEFTGNTTLSTSEFTGTYQKINSNTLKVKTHNSGNNAAAPGSFDVDTKSNIYYTKTKTRDGGSVINVMGNVYGDKFPSNETYLSDNFGNSVLLGTSGVKDSPDIGPYLLGGNGDIPMSNFNVNVQFDKRGKIIKATNNETNKPIKIDK